MTLILQNFTDSLFFNIFSMKWFAIIFLPCVAGCQTTKFVKEEGHALENHVIKTVTAMQPITCVWQCVDTPLCFSMNVRSLPTGWVTCELNNSSKTADPQDFLFSPETRYQQLVVSGCHHFTDGTDQFVNSFYKLTQSQIRKYWYVRRNPWKKYWLLWLSNQGYSIFLSNYWNIYFLLSNFRKLSIVQQSSVSTKMVSLLSFTIALQRALVKRATFLCLCYSSAQ